MMKRWEECPDLHIYHFAPYEPSAFKRLMCRYATREEEVDRMLRAGLFVDLYRVVRGGLRAGVESYSIKELEQFFGFTREVSLGAANSALFALSRALEFEDAKAIEESDMETVAGYNRDDCASTLHLRDWLENIRSQLVAQGEAIARPALVDGAASEEISERQMMIQALAERIAGDVDPWENDKDPHQYGRWVLANILDWHRREEKATWWEYFRLSELSVEELANERAALASLDFIGAVDAPGRTPVHRYRFPTQETNLRNGQPLRATGGDRLGDLVALNTKNYTVDIKKRRDTADVHPAAVFTHDHVNTGVLQEALLRLGHYVADHGITEDGPYRAARELLLRRVPSLGDEPIRASAETGLDSALRIAGKGDFGVLPIQGPPGTGKTYTAARMICELVRKGRRVGITANSHKVIANLLGEVMNAAEASSLDLRAVRKITNQPEEETPQGVTLTKDNGDVFQQLEGSCQVAAGTAWLWLGQRRWKPSTCWSWTRQRRCLWPTCWRFPTPVGTWSSSATPNNWTSRHRAFIRKEPTVPPWAIICLETARPSARTRDCFWRKPGGCIRTFAPSHPRFSTRISSRCVPVWVGRRSNPRALSGVPVCGSSPCPMLATGARPRRRLRRWLPWSMD